MYLKKLLAALTSSALLLSSLSVTGVSAADGDYTYVVNADGVSVTITGCTLYDETVIDIPASIGDYSVTAIGADAFDGGKIGTNFENLVSVTLPATVTDIDFAAFEDCDNLDSIEVAAGSSTYWSPGGVAVYSADGSVLYYVVPSAGAYTVEEGTVEIAESAMAYNDDANTITEVTIPASVTTIGRMAVAFGNAVTIYGEAGSAAETFAASNANVFVAQESVFVIEENGDGTATIVGCTDYESAEIVIPETVNGCTITAIAATAFAAADKFEENFVNVTSITIPATVTDIDFTAFEDCDNLASVVVDNDTYASADSDTAVYSADGSVLYYVVPSAGAYTVADGTVEIAENAMAYNSDANTITEITIPASVTTIGRMATVYGSAVTIYGEAGSAAETFAAANKNIFVANEELFIIEVNEDGTTATIVGCTGYESSEIVIPETYKGYTITAIAAGAFDGYAGENKFGDNFVNVTSITIPATVTDIDFAAFEDCDNLASVVVDNDTYASADNDTAVYSADGSVLYYVIPTVGVYTVADGTVEIAANAMAYNDDVNTITEVTIPASVTTIGRMATAYGSAVTIYGEAGSAAETFAAANKNIFVADEELFIIEVNEDGTTATIVGCTDYESSEIAIPETYKGYTITAIAADAFDGGKMGTNFENLTAVTIPATVEDIDFSAFNDCENLETITVDSANENYKSADGDTAVYSADGKVLHYVIPAERSYTVADGTEEIAPYALAYGNENSNNIKDITIPESVTTIGDFAAVYGPAVIIRGYVGSAAETFADKNNNTFIGDILYGDADDDGDVDGYDALYCLQASVYQVEPGEINILQGNVDGIGSDVLTSADALLILQYCSMSIDAFPIEG